MTLSALLLDLDGTLLDTNLLHARAWAAALERYGHRVPVERVAEEIGKGGELLVPALVGRRVEEEQGSALREAKEEIFLDALAGEAVAVLPGAEEIFAAARRRGLATAVATAAKRSQLEPLLERAGLDLFALADEVVTDDDVDRPKPRPDVVDAAVAKLGLSAAQCAMVGDTPYDGIAARRAGVVCLGVETGGHPPSALRRAWMRGVYRDLAALVADLDAALVVASPATVGWDHGLLEALAGEALAAAREAAEAGELPDGAAVADGEARVLARGLRRVRERHDPLAHPAIEALSEVAEARRTGGEAGANGGDGTNGSNGSNGASVPLALATVVEPCPLCLGAALVAGVDLVVWSLADPAGGGSDRCAPIDLPGVVPPRLVGGVEEEAARGVLAAWLEENPEATEAATARRLLA
ncbi:MAG TPA: HAD-IA family hydrolase [Thermoanaerobaculia bacterium]|nr:HAD-IA family hydrolase [Thermoanaerobaculia bacterium]